MRNFMIRAFEAVILAFSLLAALGVSLAAAGMVMGQVTLAELDGPLSMLGMGTEMQAQRMAAEITGRAAAGRRSGQRAGGLAQRGCGPSGRLPVDHPAERRGALTLTGIYRRMTRLVKLIETTPTE